MKKYEVISFDMFQTLVDVNQRIPEIWKGILEENYTKEKGDAGAKIILSHLSSAYKRSINPFRDMKSMFVDCASQAIQETGYSVTSEQIAYHLMYQHGYAPFFEETLSVIERLSRDYKVIISSDASHLMIDPIIERCKVDRVFISDDLCCYKGDQTNQFFTKVLKELQVEPEKVLHIGDSSSDVIGAHLTGMDSCWINREGRVWKNKIQPEYQINNLCGLFEII